MISVSQVPDHVKAPCGQVLKNGELAHREDLKKSLGKCGHRGSYLYSNGGEIKIYSCGVHDQQAIEALQKLEEQQERKALFSFFEGKVEIQEIQDPLVGPDGPSYNPFAKV